MRLVVLLHRSLRLGGRSYVIEPRGAIRVHGDRVVYLECIHMKPSGYISDLVETVDGMRGSENDTKVLALKKIG